MTLESLEALSRGRIPQFNRFIITARSQGATIGTEGYRSNPIAMTLESLEALSRGRIPQFNRFIITARSQGVTVGTEGY